MSTPQLLLFAGTVLSAVLALLAGRRSAAAGEVEALGRRLDVQARRIDELEDELDDWREYSYSLREEARNAGVPLTVTPPTKRGRSELVQ